MIRQSSVKRKRRLRKYHVTVERPVTISFPDSPYKMLREARKLRKDQIKKLYNHYSVFSCLSIIAFEYPFFLNLFELYFKKETRKKRQSKIPSFLELIKVNEILTPTLKLCLDEFYLFITELQIGSYNGAARSLRYILETAVEACEFQTERQRPTCDFLLAEYKTALRSPDKEIQQKAIDLLIRYNAWSSFVERYNIYEKTNRIAPSFRELINNLNSLEFFIDAPQVLNELKTSYETLSDYVHPSAGKFTKAISKLTSKQFSFDTNEFDLMYEFGLKVLDCTEFLYLEALMKFFNFRRKDFMKEIAKMIHPPTSLKDYFFVLPYSKHLSQNIVFTFAKKTLRKPRITAKRIKE